MSLGSFSQGDTVIRTNPDTGEKERGKVTGVGVTYVFVKYDGELGSKATYARELEIVK